MEKLGLVLSGGGSKGSYQMGAIKALNELNIKFDIVTGTSVGSLNAVMYVLQNFPKSYDLWNEVDFEQVVKMDFKPNRNKLLQLMGHATFKGSVDSTPLEELVNKHVDEEKIRNSNIKLGIVVVEYPSFKSHELTIDDIPNGRLADYLIASCSMFPVFKVKKINETNYIDGGYYDNFPINLAIKMGATKVVAIDLKSLIGKKRVKDKTVEIIKITSKKRIGTFVNFDNLLIRRNFSYGYNDTMKAFKKAFGDDYTFEKEGYLKAFADFSMLCAKILTNKNVSTHLINKKLLDFEKNKDRERRFLKVVENLARTFELDNNNFYKMDEFNKTIKNSYKDINLKKKQTLISLLRLNKKERIYCFYQLITDVVNKKEPLESLISLLNAYPDYFFYGVYLYTAFKE